MSELLWVWVALFAALVGLIIKRGSRGGALLLAYFMGLSLIHVPGALVYLGSASNLTNGDETLLGFQATILSFAALLVGAWIAKVRPVQANSSIAIPNFNHIRLGDKMLSLGMVFYFVAIPALSFIPSASALLSAGSAFLPLGLCCWFYGAHINRDRKRFFAGVVLVLTLPLITMISGGFIGYGIYWMLAVVAFIYCLSPYKSRYIAIFPVAVIFGLSFAVAYFGERTELRESVWKQQANLMSRMEHVTAMVSRLDLIDIDNPEHVRPINDRLNQNIFVGLAIERHQTGLIDLLYGGTVPIWILIPRAIWPDKPAVGGSGDVVSVATGVYFAENTSVGIGQPLEFYLNFGWAGIIVGFVLLGYLLMYLDMALAHAFRRGDVKGILVVGLPSLALLQPGGSIMEILVSFIGAIVLAYLVHWFLMKRSKMVIDQDQQPRSLR